MAVALSCMVPSVAFASPCPDSAAAITDATPCIDDDHQFPWGQHERHIGHRDRLIVAMSAPRSIVAIDPVDGRTVATLALPAATDGTASPRAPVLAASADRARIAVADPASRTILLVDAATMVPLARHAFADTPADLALSADGREVWVAWRDRPNISIHDGATLRETGMLAVDGGVAHLRFAPDGGSVLACSADGTPARTIDRATHRTVARIDQRGAGCSAAAYAPDGRHGWIALADGHGVVVADTDAPDGAARLVRQPGSVRAIAFEDNALGTIADLCGTAGTVAIDTRSLATVRHARPGPPCRRLWPAGNGVRLYLLPAGERSQVARVDPLLRRDGADLTLPGQAGDVLYLPRVPDARGRNALAGRMAAR
ncbi:MAG: hypothetical protein DI632_06030 [Sphingomonas hengshuiensis]|uniref:YncE family protein n=2 Tax=Sphingomonas TaxID=13687 RepID=A0A2W4ZAV8_9SPHN|nr:MAG: hypothetical protein DI632_06030 [Sphingomonas hengshuiensis]